MSRPFYPRALVANFSNPSEVIGLSGSVTSSSIIHGGDASEGYHGLVNLNPTVNNGDIVSGQLLITSSDTKHKFLQPVVDSVLQWNGSDLAYTDSPTIDTLNFDNGSSITTNYDNLVFSSSNVYINGISSSNKVATIDDVDNITNIHMKNECIASITSERLLEDGSIDVSYTITTDTVFTKFMTADSVNVSGLYVTNASGITNTSTITFTGVVYDLCYYTNSENSTRSNYITGDRVLINLFKSSTDQYSQMNGIYVYTAYDSNTSASPFLTRASDFNTEPDMIGGAYVFSQYTFNYGNDQKHTHICSQVIGDFNVNAQYKFVPYTTANAISLPISTNVVLLKSGNGDNTFELSSIEVSKSDTQFDTVTLAGTYNVGAVHQCSVLSEDTLTTYILSNINNEYGVYIGISNDENSVVFSKYTTSAGNNNVILSTNTNLNNITADNVVQIGVISTIMGNNSISIGGSSSLRNYNADDSIAIGTGARANGISSISIGGNSTEITGYTTANAAYSIAIGSNNLALIPDLIQANASSGTNAISLGVGSADGNNSVAINGRVYNIYDNNTINNSFGVLNSNPINQSNVSVIPASLLLYDNSTETSGTYAFANNTSRAVCLSTPIINAGITKNIILPLNTFLAVNRVSLLCLTAGTIAFMLDEGSATPPIIPLTSPTTYEKGQSIQFINFTKAYPAFRIITSSHNLGTFRILIEGILVATV